MVRSANRLCSGAMTPRSYCCPVMRMTSSETLRERQSSATHGTIRTSSCRRCISRSRGRTTDSSMPHARAVLRTQTRSPYAARELRWHYQRAVLEEFLPALIGPEMTRQILVGDRRYYRPEAAFIPLDSLA